MAVDKYANQAFVSVVPTTNVLSFAELATFVSVFEKKAFLINRIEYVFDSGLILEMDEETDLVQFGLSTSDTFAVATVGTPQVIDYNFFITLLQGAGVSSHIVKQPWVKDLSTLPGGGLLVPCRPIFLWMVTGGMSAPGELLARIYFTVVDLKAEEYWELVEATRLVGA